MTGAGFEPRTDSTVIVLPSGDKDRVSVRTTFGPPATALSLVHVVTSLPPCHFVTVSAGPPMGDSLVAGFPVRSYRVLLSSSLPCRLACVVTTSAVSDCSIAWTIFICDIMPTFLLFSGLNCHDPEKLGRSAAIASTAVTHRNTIICLSLISAPFG